MVRLIRSDLDFILNQILIAERHAAGEELADILPNAQVPWGLRTVTGTFNNLLAGQSHFGAADNVFPRMLAPVWRTAEDNPFIPGTQITNYQQTSGTVFDSQPRTISNLIVDQTANNPAAVAAAAERPGSVLVNGIRADGSPFTTYYIPNQTPDEGLSAPFNSWMTFFGQFFDHGLDLVTKGNSGTVLIPILPDDPLYSTAPGAFNFMALTRATNLPGPDGIVGDDPNTPLVDESADDIHEHKNTTSPFVDQNQTYSSHPSHQVFLRAYELDEAGKPISSGKLITNRNLGTDGEFGTTDDVEIGGMAIWAVVKAQARDVLGIDLTDADVGNVPLLRTDDYGNFIKGPNGYPLVVFGVGVDGIPNTADDVVVEGNPLIPISLTGAVRLGHAFLDDIAHTAAPKFTTGIPGPDGIPNTADDLNPDSDTVAGGTPPAGTYDNELLDAHYIAGDGRVNENIGLTTVHAIFHSEHNRLADHVKEVILADAAEMVVNGATPAEAVAFLNQWLRIDVAAVPVTPAEIDGLKWDGARIFQAAKFGTEMEYQHLVFEEFARTVQPNVDAFLAPDGYDATIDPSIVAEFAHTVYRFGHSMLTEQIDRLDPNYASSEIGLIQAFLNPLAFAASGPTPEQAAGAIVRGVTRQVGNEIDEFVTEAVRNNLVGLPLDLPAINIARGRDTGIPSLNAARTKFYEVTGDSQLKPYTSWVDFISGLKHPESVINFIAAYGTHASITGATTLADKRAAADLIVFGGAGEPTDRLDFLNATGAYAGGSLGGLNDIDFWIGGLAERQMPFGGLLGSTFNFVFETQLEALQDGDRFYYLSRTAGMNFINELENNSFAKLIMLNTDATHLPANVFSTPAFTLEANPLLQHTGLDEPGPDGIQVDDPNTVIDEEADNVPGPDGISGNSDPIGGSALLPLVMRDDPHTAAVEQNYVRYNGADHVVLGGTAGNDTLIASIGDDTLWGDGGNDRLEGGDGVDNIEGGDGDDIITDIGGDDVLKGNEGNDVISGGNGLNLIIGGGGSDFIITGEDVSETFGGTGNDFILGSQMNLPTFGNEGDDWIEIGTSDGAAGDNFNPQEAGGILGHDVFITGGGFDEVDGEGGDDIMVMSDGEDHFGGGGGFDWASYKNDPFGVTVDMLVNDFIEPLVTPSNQGIIDRFAEVEGLAGSTHADVLRGDDANLATIATGDAFDGSLTRISLINGLQALLDEAFGAPVTSFADGNIILGGGGSDIIEGRGGDDIIDGDRTLNVRVRVNGTSNPGNGGQPYSFDSISDPLLIENMLNGTWNPGQLEIVREILTATDAYDTAVFSDIRVNYDIQTVGNVTTVTHLVPDGAGGFVLGAVGVDGIDRLINVERLQFAPDPLGGIPEELTGIVDLAPGENNAPVGVLTIDDTTPAVNQIISASALGVTDADNVSGTNPTGTITGPVAYYWQVEAVPGSGIFTDIVGVDGTRPTNVSGNELRVTTDLDGLALRVRAVYKDATGVLENVFSGATAPVAGSVAPPAAPVIPAEGATASDGIHLIRGDMQFILDQIKFAEQHANGADPASIIPNTRLPFGLRTVDGTYNNLLPGQTGFGAADQDFPTLLEQFFRDDQDGDTFDVNGPAPGGVVTNTNYATTTDVVDADPRIISNLVSDQTITNPAAVAAFIEAGLGTHQLDVNGDPMYNPDGTPIILDLDNNVIPRGQTLTLPNVTPDEGLSAPFNSWMTFFGQFFDHGLDLVNKGGNGVVWVPLAADDPLRTHGPDGIAGNGDEVLPQNAFMPLTRATNTSVSAGADNVLGTEDDIHTHNNQTTPFVDQNQTYTSHPSHQVFLREYELRTVDVGLPTEHQAPFATGRLLDGAASGGLPTWAEVKAQAAMLGIALTDADITNLPLLRTDPYGRFIPDATTGMAQVITGAGTDGILNTADDAVAIGSLTTPIDTFTVNALRTDHAFLDDIAHSAAPRFSSGPLAGQMKAADADSSIGDDGDPNTYDNELLDRHFATGDGRGNENIGLTAVHHIFHAEHNRLVQHMKDVVLASNDVSFINEWLAVPIVALPANQAEIDALVWNGERVFQSARFGTEMQYQHLVFEEFARRVQPQVDVFLGEGQGYDSTINPAIVAEFAHTVYRFGHTMLTETIDRLDPNFASSQIGLVEAFLNPIAFNENNTLTAEAAAGAIVRGMTRQVGNEIDEFVTDALRNNLLGLPLDLPTINITRGRDTGVPSLNDARREFFTATGDAQLKPYVSWADFAASLRHQSSLINFIAAYGTHVSITSAATQAEMREAAMLLVLGDGDDGDGVTIRGTAYTDRHDFLNSTGTWVAAETGLNLVDFWIGGLAERQMPFGGMLGSSFNFVFENQLEKLQNGDRFYYLERTAGLNFLTELENNSFAKLIMANTNTTHLPGDVFSTPAYTLEVNPLVQYTGLGLDGRADPTGGVLLTPLVIRDNPATPGLDTNYLRYTGVDHVVLGGTSGNDIIRASIGDDTLYGDGGNDRLEGGDGVDMLLGGDGHDILTDLGGDDNLQGGEGNDVIHGGNGIDLILGGFGSDFIITGEDGDESFGGPGNDFILGERADEFVFGNEGDDWIEGGTADGSAGENFDTRGLDAIIGHDVFFGDTAVDRMLGEGGDDIMIGNGGNGDRYIGSSGFDWADFQHDSLAANVDMNLTAFDETPIAPSVVSVLSRFESMEGLSGSQFSDILRGDDRSAAQIAVSGAYGSALTANHIGLISGLQAFLDIGSVTPVVSFSGGNIILGGGGGDLIEGRGGDDLIDGDRALNVSLAIREFFDPVTGAQSGAVLGTVGNLAARVTSTNPALNGKLLTELMLSGAINPGQLQIVREILPGSAGFDTAVYSGSINEYEVTTLAGVTTVTHRLLDGNGVIIPGSIGVNGIDRLTNVERLQFNDAAQELVAGGNIAPVGNVSILDHATGQPDTTPQAGQVLRAAMASVTDGDNVSLTNPSGGITGPVAYYWQVELVPDSGIFEDIIIPSGLGVERASGPTFTVTADLVGLNLRAMAIYQDDHDVIETVFSLPTADVQVPIAPVIDSNGGGATASISLNENTTVVTTVTATDANIGDVPTFSISGGADAARFNISGTTGALTFVTAPNFESPTDTGLDNTYEVIVRAFDGLLADTQTITVTVLDVNDPIGATTDVNAATNAVDENAAAGTVVGITTQAIDEDALDTVTYSLTSNPGAMFAIDATTGVVTVAGVINRETVGATTSITVQALSSDGSTSSETFTIDINDVDEFDVSTPVDNDLAANAVNENAATGTVVGITALASDADATNNSVTYSLTSNPGGMFAIDDNTGIVTVAGAIDREAVGPTTSITVQALSSDGSTSSETFTININDVDEFDVSVPVDNNAAANAVDENAAAGTAVGITALASDADATDTVTYSLTSNPGGMFAIDDNTGIVTVAGAIDREAVGPTTSITVQALSSDGSTSSETFTIDINDVDEFDVSTPVDNDPAANVVDENAATGTVVGITALASDADATNNSVTYSLTSNPGGMFAIDDNTGIVTVAGAIDREAVGPTTSITVQALSSDGSTSSETFTININDVDEFDVSVPVDNNAAANAVDENAAAGTAVGITALASDADATDTVTYSLTSNPGGMFAIDDNTGIVTVASAIDREAVGPTTSITVQALSSDGSTSSETFTIDINDVDEFDVSVPVDTNGAANQLDENAALGSLAGITTFASDADATLNTVTYSLTNNAGGRFAIHASTGVVTLAAALDYETATSHTIEVQAESADGSTNVQSFTINVLDFRPTIIDPAGNLSGVVLGGNENELIFGLGGNDVLDGGAYGDQLDGGPGTDTASYGSSTLAVTVDLATPGNSTGDAQGDTYISIERFALSAFDDVFVGDSGANFVSGLGGNDNLSGGIGLDTLDGGTGTDTMAGGADNDLYLVDNAGDAVTELAGEGTADVVYATADWTMTAGSEIEQLRTNYGASLTGLSLSGNERNNLVVGGGVADTLSGAAGNDSLFGNAGDDNLNGGLGLDTLNGGIGADTMAGGADNDRYFVDNAGDAVTELAGAGTTDVVFATADWVMTAGSEIEQLLANYGASLTGVSLSGNGLNNFIVGGGVADTLSGAAGNDSLYGLAGDDTLNGGLGLDTLDGGTGADTMAGGAETDLYLVDNTGDVVNESIGEGTVDVVYATADWTMTAGSEIEQLRTNYGASLTGLSLSGNELNNLIVGGGVADTLSGAAGNDSLFGNAGGDNLNGGLGLDTLNGGIGADTMAGGAENDRYFVDNAGDAVNELTGEGTADVAFATADWVMTAGSEIEQLLANYGASLTGLSLSGNEMNNLIVGGGVADTLSGEAGNDSLYGNAGDDTLNGGLGLDTLDGGTGADTMAGGAETDLYLVDNTGDAVNESIGEGTADVVYASTDWTMTAGSEIEQLRANYGASATGVSLSGNELDNLIVGGGAADTISGGAGNDSLYGLAGDDTFVFAAGFGSDTVTGFDANLAGGQDRLDVRAYGYTAADIGTNIIITDLGANTRVDIGTDSILLVGVSGTAPNDITASDFIFT